MAASGSGAVRISSGRSKNRLPMALMVREQVGEDKGAGASRGEAFAMRIARGAAILRCRADRVAWARPLRRPCVSLPRRGERGQYFPRADGGGALINPYLAKMTPSEIMALMTTGFSTIANGVMAVYAGISPASPSRSVVSARWRRSGAGIWRRSACVR